jgi:tetratricopeptide (TPR) repeat protein
MANSRGVALMQINRLEEALQAIEGTDAFFASVGDKKRQAMALGNKGSALEKMKRYDEALAAYQECADIFKEIGEHDLRAPVLKSISALQFRSGKPIEAVIKLDAGLNEQENPNTAQSILKKIISIPMKWLTGS